MSKIGSKDRLYKLPCSVGSVVKIDNGERLFEDRHSSKATYNHYKVISFTISDGRMTAKLKPMWLTRAERREDAGRMAEYYIRIPASAIGGQVVKLVIQR